MMKKLFYSITFCLWGVSLTLLAVGIVNPNMHLEVVTHPMCFGVIMSMVWLSYRPSPLMKKRSHGLLVFYVVGVLLGLAMHFGLPTWTIPAVVVSALILHVILYKKFETAPAWLRRLGWLLGDE
jgi:hypothetical protein